LSRKLKERKKKKKFYFLFLRFLGNQIERDCMVNTREMKRVRIENGREAETETTRLGRSLRSKTVETEPKRIPAPTKAKHFALSSIFPFLSLSFSPVPNRDEGFESRGFVFGIVHAAWGRGRTPRRRRFEM
jgi:hypothetical protein